jgi:hypothetical protein
MGVTIPLVYKLVYKKLVINKEEVSIIEDIFYYYFKNIL